MEIIKPIIANKVNVLFVVSEFWNAGCQRYTYEIHKNINTDIFEITILSLRDLESDHNWEDHYYNLHLKLNCKIIFWNDLIKSKNDNLKSKITNKFFNKGKINVIDNFVNKFDVVSIMGEYNYNIFSKSLNNRNKNKCFIHIHNSILQHPTNYINYNFEEKYKFISSFTKKEISFELNQFNRYKHFYVPLAISVSTISKKWKIEQLNSKKIGIFTRLTKTKPIEPFIYCLQLLKDHIPNLELHVFGTGNPEELGLINHINYLGLNQSVFFRGHVKDIVETTNKEKLSIIWFQGYHGVPAGHSGFDMCSIAIPQVFWDFGSVHKNNYDPRFPMFKSLNEFVNFNLKLFNSEELVKKVCNDQFSYVKKERNMAIEVKKLEKIYIDFKNSNNDLDV